MTKMEKTDVIGTTSIRTLEAQIDTLLDQMTLAEQVSLLSGEDFWSLPAISRLGIGKLRVTDGPNGARGSGSASQGLTSAAFPVGIAIGATWDPDLTREIAKAIAVETKSKDAQVALAPTVNIQRGIANGRNFECFSEDPELSSDLTVAYVDGLQSEGIAATVKHFAGNESEIERTTINSEIDERSLREIYLRPFEDAVKKANAWGIMSAYNKLNGTYAAENEWLLQTVLRDEWGFDGIVMSDWFGSRTTVPTINAGLDLEMPGPSRDRGDVLVSAVECGEVSAVTVRERARAILRLLGRCGVLDNDPGFKERAEDLAEHRALIRRAGTDATVLLKNDGLLPLGAPTGKVAAIGPNAEEAQIMGGGSSQLNPHYAVTPLDGLTSRLGDSAVIHAPGCSNHRWEPFLHTPIHVEFFASDDLGGEVITTLELEASVDFWHPPSMGGRLSPTDFSARLRSSYTAEATGVHSFGLHAAGKARLFVNGVKVVDVWDTWVRGSTFFEEGCNEVTGLIDLVEGETYELTMDFLTVPGANLSNPAFRFGVSVPLGDNAITAAVAAATKAETAILFVGRSGEWDTEGHDLADIKLPGRQDELISAVAAANPRTVVVLQTGGPVEMPWIDEVAAVLQSWYPGQEAGNAIADVLFGDADPAGRLPQSFPRTWEDNPTHTDDPSVYPGQNGIVRYDEGLFIGYRHYTAKGIAPLFPFGHGLSYSTFALSGLETAQTKAGVTVTVTLRNTGDRAGSTVVQLYLDDDDCSVTRPERELKGFAKVQLEAGQEKKLSIQLDPRDFAFFDVASGLWRVEEGSFTLWAGFSAEKLPLQTQLTRPAETFEK